MAAAIADDEHVMVKLGGLQNKAWASDTSKFGYKMLEKMGWKAGQGVGKDLQGQATHVTIVKRTEGLGIGCSLKQAEVTGWSSTSSNFADVLAALNKSYGTAATTADSCKPAKKEKKAKKESKKENKKTSISRRILYAKRINNKNATAYDAKAMAAILGDAVGASGSSDDTNENTSSQTVSEVEEEEAARQRKKARKEAKKAKKAAKEASD
ncbi:hypothetical protein H310_01651 [Aphanomyces invadans]|uniref:PinX1-related protein 1 n=1 Tax=Aphanomyces invadans TaxID=157072 RepID=A0A024UTJ5_9STRA|nr:hypothetical protein H310_01651 [Aphanomyces invadans]ETW09252.1 hypothetical protein H310_01651 [Aphanomyces invadans]RHY31142.1 hypothetical protein DYB32_004124 [Aphanomyces invadans]|eukprot:XP_008863057.1 hypothetical protein H310_01651 [Aphanomyces invadans]